MNVLLPSVNGWWHNIRLILHMKLTQQDTRWHWHLNTCSFFFKTGQHRMAMRDHVCPLYILPSFSQFIEGSNCFSSDSSTCSFKKHHNNTCPRTWCGWNFAIFLETRNETLSILQMCFKWDDHLIIDRPNLTVKTTLLMCALWMWTIFEGFWITFEGYKIHT